MAFTEAVKFNKARGYTPSTWKKIQKGVGALPDGNPGPATAKAVSIYQQHKGLEDDGKVGALTLRALGVIPKKTTGGKYGVVGISERFPTLELGIDVSNYQGLIDWKRVKDTGVVKFVIAKASEGRTHLQSSFSRNITGARNYGIPVSAYHLARLTDRVVTQEMSAEGGAENFMEMLQGFCLDLPPFLDLEHKQVKQMVDLKGSGQAVSWIKRWLDHYMYLNGDKSPLPGLYLSHRTARLIGAPKELTKLVSWWAYYKTSTWGDPPKRGADWGWNIRQFTSSGKVPGIMGDVDLNYANGKVDDLLSVWSY